MKFITKRIRYLLVITLIFISGAFDTQAYAYAAAPETADISSQPYAAWDSGEAMSAERFAALINEAEKYIGMPYTWGGSTPETSFDCSGFICWVLNQSGIADIERTTAQGLYDYCEPIPPNEAEPGDLIFFHSTYPNSNTVTHVGIYAGNGNLMLHCGDPVKYEFFNTDYWTAHFFSYGKIPS